MERILSFLWGYVVITVEGEQIERFLTLCRSRQIVLSRIYCLEERKLFMQLSVKDFLLLRPIRNKTKVHIRIVEKHGLPFFFYRNKKRKAFFIGLLACVIMLAVLSGRIWNIHIEGNVQNSTPQILQFLQEHQIVHGMEKKRVNCAQLSALIRKKFPEITWVSAKISGTRLLLVIQEGKMLSEDQEEQSPCSLVSELDGTIIKMVTRRGSPQVKEGDVCKKGDLLVEGVIPIKNDEQEVVRYETVHADADIYVSHAVSYYDEFLLKHVSMTFEKKEKKRCYLKLGNWYLGGCERQEGYCCLTMEYPVRITENFTLPISFGNIILQKYEKKVCTYTEEQAKALAFERLHIYEENLIRKGVQISENNVRIKINRTACIASGTLQLVEQTGREVPAEQYDQPTERTAKDG